ncbi:MAG: hypothetical protein Kow00123_15360 [Anaerolineales bacterium]
MLHRQARRARDAHVVQAVHGDFRITPARVGDLRLAGGERNADFSCPAGIVGSLGFLLRRRRNIRGLLGQGHAWHESEQSADNKNA